MSNKKLRECTIDELIETCSKRKGTKLPCLYCDFNKFCEQMGEMRLVYHIDSDILDMEVKNV